MKNSNYSAFTIDRCMLFKHLLHLLLLLKMIYVQRMKPQNSDSQKIRMLHKSNELHILNVGLVQSMSVHVLCCIYIQYTVFSWFSICSSGANKYCMKLRQSACGFAEGQVSLD